MNINKYLQPGESVNVIASAGTGKTWFIISKILRLLLDDVEPEKITAITFTKKSTLPRQTKLLRQTSRAIPLKFPLYDRFGLHGLKRIENGWTL